MQPLKDKTLFVYVDNEKQKQAAISFFGRAFDAAQKPSGYKRTPGQDLAKGYTEFKVIVADEPQRPAREDAPDTVWYTF